MDNFIYNSEMLSFALMNDNPILGNLEESYYETSELSNNIETMDSNSDDSFELKSDLDIDSFQYTESWSSDLSYSFEFPIINSSTPTIVDYLTPPKAQIKPQAAETVRAARNRKKQQRSSSKKLAFVDCKLNSKTESNLLVPIADSRVPPLSEAEFSPILVESNVQIELPHNIIESAADESCSVVTSYGYSPTNLVDDSLKYGFGDSEIGDLFIGNGTNYFDKYGRNVDEKSPSGLPAHFFEMLEECTRILQTGCPETAYSHLNEHDYAYGAVQSNEESSSSSVRIDKFSGQGVRIRAEPRVSIPRWTETKAKNCDSTKKEKKSSRSKHEFSLPNAVVTKEGGVQLPKKGGKLQGRDEFAKPKVPSKRADQTKSKSKRSSSKEKKTTGRWASASESDDDRVVSKSKMRERSNDSDKLEKMNEVAARSKRKQGRRNEHCSRKRKSLNEENRANSTSSNHSADEIPDCELNKWKPVVLVPRVTILEPKLEQSAQSASNEISAEPKPSEVAAATKPQKTEAVITCEMATTTAKWENVAVSSSVAGEATGDGSALNISVEDSKEEIAAEELTPADDNSKKKISLSEYKQRKLEAAVPAQIVKPVAIVGPQFTSTPILDSDVTKKLMKMREEFQLKSKKQTKHPSPRKRRHETLRKYKLIPIDFGDVQKKNVWPEFIENLRRREKEDTLDEGVKLDLEIPKSESEVDDKGGELEKSPEEESASHVVAAAAADNGKTFEGEKAENKIFLSDLNVSPTWSSVSSGIYSQPCSIESSSGDSPFEAEEKNAVKVIKESPFALNLELLKGLDEDEYRHRKKSNRNDRDYRKKRHSREDDREGCQIDEYRMSKRSRRYSFSPSSSIASPLSETYSSPGGYSVSPNTFYEYGVNPAYYYGMPMYYPPPVGYVPGFLPENQCYPTQPYNTGRFQGSRDKKSIEAIEQCRVLYVDNLEYSITEAEFRKRFEKFGAVETVKIVHRPPRTFGFVTYVEKNKVWDAMAKAKHDTSLPPYKYGLGRSDAATEKIYSDLEHSDGSYRESPTTTQFDAKLKEFKSELERMKACCS